MLVAQPRHNQFDSVVIRVDEGRGEEDDGKATLMNEDVQTRETAFIRGTLQPLSTAPASPEQSLRATETMQYYISRYWAAKAAVRLSIVSSRLLTN